MIKKVDDAISFIQSQRNLMPLNDSHDGERMEEKKCITKLNTPELFFGVKTRLICLNSKPRVNKKKKRDFCPLENELSFYFEM